LMGVQIPAIHVCSYDVGQCEVSNLNEDLNLFDPTFCLILARFLHVLGKNSVSIWLS